MDVCIIPAKNEEKTIKDIVIEANKHSDITIVVDDGSTDSTLSILKNIRNELFVKSPIYILENPSNLGKGKALFNAYWWIYWNIKVNANDNIIVMDADRQHNPKHIPEMKKLMERESYKMVIGERNIDSYPFYKWLGNRGLSKISSWLAKTKIKDGESGFRIMKWCVVLSLLKNINPNKYEIEILTNIVAGRLGYSIGFFKLDEKYYRHGVSLLNGLMNGYNGIKMVGKELKK